jgi:glycosyltransferase involved in cell wall biosynthesis
MSISIVMPTLNKDPYLPYTLASLRAQTYSDFQLIVVDDGGSGRAGDLLRRHAPEIDVVYLREPHRGRAAARNKGLEHVGGDLVVFLDDDRIVSPDFLAAHHRRLSRGDDIASIGWKRRCLTLWLRGRLPVIEADFIALLRAHESARQWLTADEHQVLEPGELAEETERALSLVDLGDDLDNHSAVVDAFPDELTGFRLGWALGTTGNLAVHTSALRAVGGFDETYSGWGIEDTDLCYRLGRAGIRFQVDRQAVNYHQVHPPGPGRVSAALRQRRVEALINTRRFCRVHDTLDTQLYWQAVTGAMSFLEANVLLGEVAGGEVPCVEAELKRLYRHAAAAETHDAFTAGHRG